MGRKKKKDDDYLLSEVYAPTEVDITSLDDSFRTKAYDLSPYTITTTTMHGDSRTYVLPNPPMYSPSTGWSTTISGSVYDWKKQIEKEEIGDVHLINKTDPLANDYIVACHDINDLSTERILKTLSAMKGKMAIDIAPIHIQKVECRMTPGVRKNIVNASKRLKMYGKKAPIIARFDEYGNRLPDEIELDTPYGITLKIVDPKDYGPLYLDMRAISFPSQEYKVIEDDTIWDALGDDIPF